MTIPLTKYIFKKQNKAQNLKDIVSGLFNIYHHMHGDGAIIGLLDSGRNRALLPGYTQDIQYRLGI